MYFFFNCSDHLRVLHSFPTRRSSELAVPDARARRHALELAGPQHRAVPQAVLVGQRDRKSTRLNSSHLGISYAVFCLKKKTTMDQPLSCGRAWGARAAAGTSMYELD